MKLIAYTWTYEDAIRCCVSPRCLRPPKSFGQDGLATDPAAEAGPDHVCRRPGGASRPSRRAPSRASLRR